MLFLSFFFQQYCSSGDGSDLSEHIFIFYLFPLLLQYYNNVFHSIFGYIILPFWVTHAYVIIDMLYFIFNQKLYYDCTIVHEVIMQSNNTNEILSIILQLIFVLFFRNISLFVFNKLLLPSSHIMCILCVCLVLIIKKSTSPTFDQKLHILYIQENFKTYFIQKYI